MSKINVGDRVTCINATPKPSQVGTTTGLVEGRDYIVYGVKTNPCCGTKVLDVGLINTSAKESICICGADNKRVDGVNWKSASRFIKKEESTKTEEKVNVIKLTEDLCISQN